MRKVPLVDDAVRRRAKVGADEVEEAEIVALILDELRLLSSFVAEDCC